MESQAFSCLKELQSLGIIYDIDSTRFEEDVEISVDTIKNQLTSPISVILQITRNCHLDCIFCSETEEFEDPDFDIMRTICQNLVGTARVFLSGGEPTTRTDLDKIIDLFSEKFIIGLPTNALIPERLISSIKDKVAFVNIGLDGPRGITNRVRGDYDQIMKGILRLKKHKIKISLTAVILSSTLDSIPFMCQIADVLNAQKLKLVLPIQKGRALSLPDEEFVDNIKLKTLCEDLKNYKKKFKWKTIITLTPWTKDVEGYSILIYPNGNTYAWPVYNEEHKRLLLGNIINEDIQSIWKKYPYKSNHIKKYLGKSIFII